MKKIVLLLILSFVFLKLRPQSIGVYGGVNMNTNTHSIKQVSDYNIYFPAKFGASVGLGIEFFKIADLPIRMTCSFDNFNGTIKERTMGMMGGACSELNANYNKQSLGFGIHLLNKKIKGNLRISLGGEYNILIREKLDGFSRSWYMYSTSIKTINENDIKLSKNSFGLIGTIGYETNITNVLFILPQLSLYLGLTKEEILENEKLWLEERDNPDYSSTGADLRSVGVTPGGIESDISTGEELGDLGGAAPDASAPAGAAAGQGVPTAGTTVPGAAPG